MDGLCMLITLMKLCMDHKICHVISMNIPTNLLIVS